jgi:hypothetical protein
VSTVLSRVSHTASKKHNISKWTLSFGLDKSCKKL